MSSVGPSPPGMLGGWGVGAFFFKKINATFHPCPGFVRAGSRQKQTAIKESDLQGAGGAICPLQSGSYSDLHDTQNGLISRTYC